MQWRVKLIYSESVNGQSDKVLIFIFLNELDDLNVAVVSSISVVSSVYALSCPISHHFVDFCFYLPVPVSVSIDELVDSILEFPVAFIELFFVFKRPSVILS